MNQNVNSASPLKEDPRITIDRCTEAWESLNDARAAFKKAFLGDKLCKIEFADGQPPGDLFGGKTRILTHLDDIYFFNEVGNAKHLHAIAGVSTTTIQTIENLNTAKDTFYDALPGEKASYAGTRFNRYIAGLLAPKDYRLSFQALLRILPVAPTIDQHPSTPDSDRPILKRVSVNSYMHTKSDRIPLEAAYQLVGGHAEAMSLDQDEKHALLSQLPTGNGKSLVSLFDPRGRVYSQAKLSYYNPRNNRKLQRTKKLANPIFYDIEKLPEMVTKVALIDYRDEDRLRHREADKIIDFGHRSLYKINPRANN